MMRFKTLIILAAAFCALVLVGVVGAQGLSAVEAKEYPPIVKKIAERFNLNADEVNQVFTEERTERIADRLDQAVKDGEITAKQKEAILAKQAELDKEREVLKDLALEEMRTAMQKLMTDAQKWAEDNDIDMRYLMPGRGGFGRPGGRGGHVCDGGRPDFGQQP